MLPITETLVFEDLISSIISALKARAIASPILNLSIMTQNSDG